MTRKEPYTLAGKRVTKNQLDIAKSIGLTTDNIRKRIMKGWTVTQACTLPKGTPVKRIGAVKGKPKHKMRMKTKPSDLRLEIGRIKYMINQDLLNPPCITTNMIERAKEYGIDIDKIKPVKVDVKGLPKLSDYKVRESDHD